MSYSFSEQTYSGSSEGYRVLDSASVNSSAVLGGFSLQSGLYASSSGSSGQSLYTYSDAGASSNGRVNQVANDLLSLSGAGNGFGGRPSAVGVSGTTTSTSNQVNVASTAESNSVYLSQIEQAILRSTVPIDVNETEEITVLGQRGIWANRSEVVSWRGVVPITEYIINEDANPEIITKRVTQQLEYVQELAIRYLRPPTPPAPGEIVIVQQGNSLTAPAPPLVIRQQPPRPSTPEPLVVREAPPPAPPTVGRKVITIFGKRAPPPTRKVVIERLAPLPAKPQSMLVERWLPYSQVKRRVVFQRESASGAVIVKPRNVVVQWEAPQVSIKREVKYLGVIRANPVEYVQRYGAELKQAKDLPQFVLDIKTPDELVLAANYQFNSVYELEGDLQAFRLVDLEREGLVEYRPQLQKLGISYAGVSAATSGGVTFELSGVSSGGNTGASHQSAASGTYLASGRVADISSVDSVFVSDSRSLGSQTQVSSASDYGLVASGGVSDQSSSVQAESSPFSFTSMSMKY